MYSVNINGKVVDGVKPGTKLISVLQDNGYKVKGLCGGRGRCATCHVYVNENAASLDAETSQERLTLAVLTSAAGNSRLACQSVVSSDGLHISLPEAIYFEGDSDIDPYIGKPSPADVLHPVTGDVLIPKGKLIIRSILLSLAEVKEEISQYETQNK